MRRPLSYPLVACAAAAGLLAISSCGSGGVGGVSFTEAKRQVAALVDGTYEAVLSELEPRPFPQNATPCRQAGGAGGATGDYAPGGALEFDVPRGEDGKRLVTRVKEHWEAQDFESIQLVPSGEAVFARTDGYRLSFEITPKLRRAKLGAGGPCATPESEAERKSPPEFGALSRD